MDKLCIFIILFLGVIATSQVEISGSVLELKVRPGENINLYCDCKTSTGVYIMWYRNCSHVNQPTLVLGTRYPHEKLLGHDYSYDILNPFPRFHLVKNQTSESYDLLITNITDSDEGLYYCGTEQAKVEDKGHVTHRYVYSYGSVTTRILLLEYHRHENPQDCGLCWTLLLSLCPVFAVFSALLSALLVHHLCKKTAKEPQVDKKRSETRGHTRGNQDELVCYAALEIHQASQKPKKKKNQSLDYSTYSTINTCRL